MKNEHIDKKRGPWLEIILISSIVLLLLFIVFFSLSTGNSKFQNLLSASKYNSIIEVTNTEFQNIKKITETSKDPSISFKLAYPETKYDVLNEKITKYIVDSKKTYISNIHEKEKKNGHLNINFAIYPFKENYYSIVFIKTVTYDFSIYDIEYHTYFIEKNNGKIIGLNSLLNNDISHLTLFSNYLQNNLLQSKELKNKVNKETIIHATNPLWENFNSFSIVDDQLVIYFNMGKTETKESINPIVKIPIPYLNPILAANFQSDKKEKTNIVSDEEKKKRKATKRVALTFDDGPHPKVTRQILKSLEKYDAKATFFVIGSQIDKNKQILKEIKEKGHEIGNHTWNHPKLTKLTVKQIEKEINSTNKKIKEATGEESTVFRPPYGSTNQNINKMVNVPVVLWTLDTLDWKYRNPKKLLPVVKNNIHNNAIILMHDIHQSTADGLESVLAYLQEEGYEFVTVSEIVNAQH